MSLLLAPYTVLDVPLNWLFDPVIVLDESFWVVLAVMFCWFVSMDLNLDLSASKASIEACLSFNPPISKAKGDAVVDDDTVVEELIVDTFSGCDSAVIDLCYVVSGAMAPFTINDCTNRISMMFRVIDFVCMGVFLNRNYMNGIYTKNNLRR